MVDVPKEVKSEVEFVVICRIPDPWTGLSTVLYCSAVPVSPRRFSATSMEGGRTLSCQTESSHIENQRRGLFRSLRLVLMLQRAGTLLRDPQFDKKAGCGAHRTLLRPVRTGQHGSKSSIYSTASCGSIPPDEFIAAINQSSSNNLMLILFTATREIASVSASLCDRVNKFMTVQRSRDVSSSWSPAI